MLTKAQLEADILEAFDSVSDDSEIDPASAREIIAQKLAIAIDTFVKSGTVNVTVNTTGTASAQTGTGTGTIS